MRRVALIARLSLAGLSLAGLCLAMPSTAAAGRAADRGHRLAVSSCSSCHAVERTGLSPNPKSPPFRDIAAIYEEHSLQKKLTEIDETGHYDMPPIQVHSNQISDLVAYFNRLNQRAARAR